MDPSCFVSLIPAGGGSIIANYGHPFMSTVYTSFHDYFRQNNMLCHRVYFVSNWIIRYNNKFTVFKCFS